VTTTSIQHAGKNGHLNPVGPPHNVEAEQAVIGAILTDDRIMDEIEHLRPGHFYRNAYGQVYQCCIDIRRRKEDVNLITLLKEVTARGIFTLDDARRNLTTCCEVCDQTYRAVSYANLIIEAHNRMRMIQSAATLEMLGRDETRPYDECQEEAERTVYALRPENTGRDSINLSLKFREMFEQAEAKHQQNIEDREKGIRRPRLSGVTSGYGRLDYYSNGLQPGELYVIGARTSLGKTSFSLCVAANVAKTHRPVLINSLEMTAEAVSKRMLAIFARVPWQVIESGDINEMDWERLSNAVVLMDTLDITVVDGDYTIEEQRARMRQFTRAKGSCGLYVCDYIQRMRTKGRIENRTTQVGGFANDLQDMAKEYMVPIITPAQVGRAGEGQEPSLEMLRESGDIENAASMVMFLHRDRFIGIGAPPPIQPTRAIVAKNRNGPTGRFDIGFEAPYASYIDVEYTLVAPDEPGRAEPGIHTVDYHTGF
jgi:replicative DNA helicase